MRRWLAPGLLLVVTGWSLFMAAGAATDRRGTAASTEPELATPVLSARRAAPLLSATSSHLRLRRGVAGALARTPNTRTCLVVNDDKGRPLFEQAVSDPLIPASNMKLLTGYAALDRLGPDSRLTTTVKATSRPAAGVVQGNLFLVGAGDPVLQTAEYNAALKEAQLPPDGYTHFEDLVESVKAAGVTRITGSVIGDESRYDTVRSIPSWKPGYITAAEVGPLSALELNDGFVTYRNPVTVPAPAPAVLAAGTLTSLLEKAGIDVGGDAAQGVTPAGGVTIGSVQSPPMSALVAQMMRESDNTAAELLTKELGVRFGDGGSTPAGTAVIKETLRAAGVPLEGLAAVDGSGLDRANRATCDLLRDVLIRSGPAGALALGLPVAGETGTLRKRFLGTTAGRLAAKTGSLDGVTALSGFTRGSSPLTFALVSNEVASEAAGRALQDRVGAVLAAYPAGPAVSEIDPLPPRAAASGATDTTVEENR